MFKFEQLGPYGQQKARERYGAPPDDWAEEILAEARHDGVERGFNIANINWSGFHSQGDGASWVGHIDILPFLAYHNKPEHKDYAHYTILAELIKDGWLDKRASVERRAYYYNHSGTMHVEDIDTIYHTLLTFNRIEKGILEGANVQELWESIDGDYLLVQLQEWMQSEARKYADEVYAKLDKEYDAYTEEGYFEMLCDINEWRFDINGYITY